jgi:hypothetical protein
MIGRNKVRNKTRQKEKEEIIKRKGINEERKQSKVTYIAFCGARIGGLLTASVR